MYMYIYICCRVYIGIVEGLYNLLRKGFYGDYRGMGVRRVLDVVFGA